MTIHNLTPQATILYASESIADILGFQPEDVTGKSCFEYFHPEEVPAAEDIYHRGVRKDITTALHNVHIRRQDGQWVGCECVFTIVCETSIAFTSIYKGEERNERRRVRRTKSHKLIYDRPSCKCPSDSTSFRVLSERSPVPYAGRHVLQVQGQSSSASP